MLWRMHADLHDWITPDWAAPGHVHALCTTRSGGVSMAPWASCNLGERVGDDARAVQANRTLLAAALRDINAPARPVYLRQVHGTRVLRLDGSSQDGQEADASTTQVSGVVCTVLVGDCLPVLFTNRSGTRVAAAHAGWRGLAAGVLEQTLKCFAPRTDGGSASSATDSEVMAWLGPCIGPQAFEVGTEVYEAFCAYDPGADRCFTGAARPGKYLADLAGLARLRLRAAGVMQVFGNDGTPSWCTVGNTSRFFSHRRDTAALGGSGRMAACIWIGR